MTGKLLFLALMLGTLATTWAEDGYRLWLRYEPVEDRVLQDRYASRLQKIVFVTPTGANSSTIAVAKRELEVGLRQMLGMEPKFELKRNAADLHPEGFMIRSETEAETTIEAGGDAGILYGAFTLLRNIQTRRGLDNLGINSSPKIQLRLLNHWDNLDRTIERGTAGFSLWNWFELPHYMDPRYVDYARACASIGVNGTVLTNVNANALILTPEYLEKVRALADVFRPYNLRVYLTARFSAPTEIGGLEAADPLNPDVADWWKAKVEEIYNIIPDFGGFLVKANSEGQPGPQDYGRTHAEGANMLAEALAPHGGVVMWRAFVYSHEVPEDRAKHAYNEFEPLDGEFLPNVIVQIKNGPIDFMPREPFHPLFGAMPETSLGLELQIAQEYLGASVHLAFLGPLFEEVLGADTFSKGPRSTVGRIVSGELDKRDLSMIAGVANTGNSRNWTGHPMAAANWYAFGRLAWDVELPSRQIAEEWTRMTFSNDPELVETIVPMLLHSREAVVNYMMPLGLHHIMAYGHHYGPGPWVDQGRPDWTSVYYHRADERGIGFDRTATGSNAVAQYFPEVAEVFENIDRTPPELLLWFHHAAWDYEMPTGATLWDELALRYQSGVDSVRRWRVQWDSLRDKVDAQRWAHVRALLARQEKDAKEWRDACLLYFQTFSKRPLPDGVESPEHNLEYYKGKQIHHFPGDPAG